LDLRVLPLLVLGRIVIGEYIEITTAATLPRLLSSVSIVFEEDGETSPAAALALPHSCAGLASLFGRM
jgi:hypothetical protein